jgi:hypothetical protein
MHDLADAAKEWQVRWTNEAYERATKALSELDVTGTTTHAVLAGAATKEKVQEMHALLQTEFLTRRKLRKLSERYDQ